MFIGKGMRLLVGAVDSLSPEIQSPVNELSGELIHNGIFDNYSPSSHARLTPAEKKKWLEIGIAKL
jgi:hypothetical protein